MYHMPTSSKSLNNLLLGGIPCAAITEVVGEPNHTRRVAYALLQEQQRRFSNARSFWLDMAGEVNEERIRSAGLDPDALCVLTQDAVEGEDYDFLAKTMMIGKTGKEYMGFAGVVLSGFQEGWQDRKDIAIPWAEMVKILEPAHAFIVCLVAPTQVSKLLARAATVRLRVTQPVAARDPEEVIVTLVKHWRAPTVSARRILLPA